MESRIGRGARRRAHSASATCARSTVPYPGRLSLLQLVMNGVADWYRVMHDLYLNTLQLTSVEAVVPVYAPASDYNDPLSMIAGIRQLVSCWRGAVDSCPADPPGMAAVVARDWAQPVMLPYTRTMRQRLIAVGRPGRAGNGDESSRHAAVGSRRTAGNAAEQLWTGSSQPTTTPPPGRPGGPLSCGSVGGRRSRPCAVDLGRSAGLEAEASAAYDWPVRGPGSGAAGRAARQRRKRGPCRLSGPYRRPHSSRPCCS